ncbi:MAG: branched-chain amino acid ABC transporter permease [Pseudomonadales bacterium]|nr:branched-chain amino acid ABC transporter permease [Pseudomonadales bacterium]
MNIFVQELVNGLVLGCVYALIALGYTMVYGIVGLINFAHGEVVMVGALTGIACLQVLLAQGEAPWMAVSLATAVAIIACMLLGWLIERIAYRPLRRAPRLAPLISAIGVSMVLQNLAMLIWGRGYQLFPPVFTDIPLRLLGARITHVQVGIVVVCASMMLALMLLVHRTSLGRAMRAVAQNPDAARLMGVHVDRIISMTFVIGSAMAATAGMMVSANYGQGYAYMGFLLGLKAFSAAVLGGIGNLGGAVLGGILLGLIESTGAAYLGPLTGGFLGSQYQDVFAFVILILVLIFKPSGLLGHRLSERA